MFIEKIVCAAIKYPDGTILCGVRHCDIIKQADMLLNIDSHECEQGFMNNKGNFLDRRTARKIAVLNGQVESTDDYLYSEDLY